MVRVTKQQGYTLVEMMIALVILVSLMFTANYSYSLYSNYWSGRLGEFDRSMFYYQGLMQVKESIDSAIPYVVKDEKDTFTFYFLGRREGFTLVSAAPIFAPTVNDASVVRIFAEPVQDQNQYQLVYEEAPLIDGLLLKLDQQLSFKYRTVLFRSEHPISFRYFGWDAREHKRDSISNESIKASWRDNYDAAITRIQPQKIAMTIGSEELFYELPSGQEKLLNFYIDGKDKL